ncbi:heparan-alpha-glucosaminide N-acetyltransferase domain-containing protein [Aureibaculum sp. 2210JD6-5]|uniref:acyltransferase family protein n=1 Tax=Aureibaculum sp. 2210JD6-5 TaxID=3103957 RepID=UPI002AAE4BF6|nr:heparan-alpha-glucosaminide N-acetyltransferase domain-containing protein [Aureibaculum sp. 2210JD6-5]MDY7393973.1 heparan-alpha-glucosaminide N-acetyltransferase domain-containing protein [Aureibaculum sp. 2210JD6-5]
MKNRVESVDILRGLTIVAMILVNNPGSWGSVYAPLLHADWHGLTPTDLIFPFFLFIVGISISYAYKNKANTGSTYKKITIRSLKLIGLGLFLGWFLPYWPFFKDFETLRFPGVLQRIGVVFFISAILFLNFNWKQLLGIGVTILIGYWLFLGFVPLPDGTQPTFNRAPNNWANYIDLKVLGNHMWKDDYDPEGLLSTLPAIATCISGILIGRVLASREFRKTRSLLIIGLLLLVLGYGWSNWFPLNKAIWSSSFVLVTSGWATVILAIVYFITDVKKVKVGRIFKYVGMNAITIFFLSGFIAKSFYLTKIDENYNIHSWLYETFYTSWISVDKLASLTYALTVIAFYLLLGYVMYKKKIFIKV